MTMIKLSALKLDTSELKTFFSFYAICIPHVFKLLALVPTPTLTGHYIAFGLIVVIAFSVPAVIAYCITMLGRLAIKLLYVVVDFGFDLSQRVR
jgi:hypothetical protein